MKVAYLHGRPSAHYIHQDLAKTWDADFYFVDQDFQWQDEKMSAAKRTWFWIRNAFSYRKYREYDVILVDNLHFSPVIARKLGIIKKNQKMVVHMGSHTLYFMSRNLFGSFATKLHCWALRQYDEIICEGEYSLNIAEKIVGSKQHIHYSFLGPKEEKVAALQKLKPELNGKTLLNISQVEDNDFRWNYKGIDIMLMGFELALSEFPDLKLVLIGDFGTVNRELILKQLQPNTREHIFFEGYQKNLEAYYANSDLYLHVARGDAFPTTSIEAMHAGLPCLVSEDTGTREVVLKATNLLVCKTEIEDCGEKIKEYFRLTSTEKKILQEKVQNAVQSYTEKNSHLNYRRILSIITKVNGNG
ncbi:MAG: group 1 glycosyl transferase [Fluviicola sp.]|jgi:glycosyltransferase involved in cell wall biosynthesis|uniref:glycosyltransferase family 4 protein n=1 Tax=Fluviicola sp. TaxID=1917219 RepID=UPI00261B9F95|nr:glycosyltransferase family 4 protein [Fluviicola sp.]MDF3027776.1 group 1 glycosyl transferase [Fluviicola sp.]